jgi:hypothetical protein
MTLMKHIAVVTLMMITVSNAPLSAQTLPDQIPDGAVLPRNLNALGGMMADRVGDFIRDEISQSVDESDTGRQLDLFIGESDEDPNLSEIRRIARELETQRSVILKLSELQSDLIAFGSADPSAAYRSRIPVAVCEFAIAPEFCEHLKASFQ